MFLPEDATIKWQHCCRAAGLENPTTRFCEKVRDGECWSSQDTKQRLHAVTCAKLDTTVRCCIEECGIEVFKGT
jgi:hypothetical protein